MQASYRQKCKFMPEAVCCCLQTCNFGFDMRAIYTLPVHQVLPEKLTHKLKRVFNARGCLLLFTNL